MQLKREIDKIILHTLCFMGYFQSWESKIIFLLFGGHPVYVQRVCTYFQTIVYNDVYLRVLEYT